MNEAIRFRLGARHRRALSGVFGVLGSLAACSVARGVPDAAGLTLSGAVERALSQAPGVAVARSDAEEAAAGARLAEAGFRPEAFATTTPGYTTGLPVLVAGHVPSVFGLEVRSALYDPNRRAAALGSRAEAFRRSAGLSQAAEETARAVILAYSRNWSGASLVEASRRGVEAAESMARRALALRAEGRATDLEVQFAELEVARAKARLLDRTVQQDLDRFELRSLLGMEERDPVVLLEDPLVALADPPPWEDLRFARAADPQLAAAEERIEALRQAADVQARAFRPVVLAQAQYLRLASYNDFDQYFVRFKPNDFSVALSVSVPLWTGGRREEAAAASRARLAGAEAARRQRDAELAGEILRAQGELSRARARHSISGVAERVAQERLRIARAFASEGREEPDAVEAAEVALLRTREESAAAAQALLAARVAVLARRGELPGTH